jgi:hypothetical protein
LLERMAQCGWFGKVSGDCESSQVVDVDRHIQQCPQITQTNLYLCNLWMLYYALSGPQHVNDEPQLSKPRDLR